MKNKKPNPVLRSRIHSLNNQIAVLAYSKKPENYTKVLNKINHVNKLMKLG